MSNLEYHENPTDAFRRYYQDHAVQGTDGDCWSQSESRDYLSQTAQDAYFTDEQIKYIRERLWPRYDAPEMYDLTTRYRGVFIILLYIGRADLIHSFTARRELQSDRLPFLSRETFPSPGILFDDFYEAQWKFCVFRMRYEPVAEHATRQIMPFQIIEKLGQGQSGQAYLIKVAEGYDEIAVGESRISEPSASSSQSSGITTVESATPSQYVVKCFHSKHRPQNETKETWLKEARNHAAVRKSINRKNIGGILQFYGSFSHGDTFCILLEHANIGNLEQVFRGNLEHPEDPRDRLDFWMSYFALLSTLSALRNLVYEHDNHTYQLCHFDIKPSNILVFRENTEQDSKEEVRQYKLRFKLGDLGSSRHRRLLDGSENHLLQNPGTRSYGAPECYSINFEGNTTPPNLVDASIDLYSFGCVGSEIVAWMISGIKGIDHYRYLRKVANHRLEDTDAFHDGSKTLDVVIKHHDFLKTHIQEGSATDFAIDLIQTEMLCSDPQQRGDPHALMTRAKQALEEVDDRLKSASRVVSQDRAFVHARTPPSLPPRSAAGAAQSSITNPGTAPTFVPYAPTRPSDGKRRAISGSYVDNIHSSPHQQLYFERPVAQDRSASEIDARSIDGLGIDTAKDRISQHAHFGQVPDLPMVPAASAALEARSLDPAPDIFHTGQGHRAFQRNQDSLPAQSKFTIADAKKWKESSKSANWIKELFRSTRAGDDHRWDWLTNQFKDRDFILLVDDSASMRPHWEEVMLCVDLLAFCTAPYDDDGIELRYTISPKTLRHKSVDEFRRHAAKRRPPKPDDKISRTTNMSAALSNALKGFQDKFTGQGRRRDVLSIFKPTQRKGLIVFVLSDGLWDQENDVKKPIQRLIGTLKDSKQDSAKAGIQFICFGDNEDGWARMQELDDFIYDPDIVDAEHFRDADFLKILLGSIDKAYDRRETRPASMASASTSGIGSPQWSPRSSAQMHSPSSPSGPSFDSRRISSGSNRKRSSQPGSRPGRINEES